MSEMNVNNIERIADVKLLPWQRDLAERVLAGEKLVTFQSRNYGHRLVERYLSEMATLLENRAMLENGDDPTTTSNGV